MKVNKRNVLPTLSMFLDLTFKRNKTMLIEHTKKKKYNEVKE
jgi:hypothetical protein